VYLPLCHCVITCGEYLQAISVLGAAPAVPLAADRFTFLQRILAVLPLVRPLLPRNRVITVLSEVGLALCPDSPEGQSLASRLFDEAASLVAVYNPQNTAYFALLKRLAQAPPKTTEEAAAAELGCCATEQ
jgi:hypothetical protein